MIITSNATFQLWLFSHFRLETKPPKILTMSRAQLDRTCPCFDRPHLHRPPHSAALTALPEWKLSVASRSKNQPGRGTLPPFGVAHVPQLNPPALGRGDQPLPRARSALLSISDAFVSGGWDCFPCCQWENRDDFTPIFGKDSLWKTNYNADCHFN